MFFINKHMEVKNLINKVLEFIRKNSMVTNGDKVIVAVSGGPDSICLLDILNKLKHDLNIEILVAHVNHLLRGKEADEDEMYVKNYCISNDIPFHSIKVDVHRISQEKNISCESAGREVRYQYFKQLMESENATKVAIAHNANDRAETVLMRIIRGTGLNGLEGIKPVRDTIFIRPILCLLRKEIEQYCVENHLCPRIDKTNLERIYARNKIRLDIIPYIQKNFNKDIVSGLNRLADTVTTDNEYLNSEAMRKYKKYCDKADEKVIIYKEAFKEPEAILSRIIIQAIGEVKGDSSNIEKNHIAQIESLAAGETGKEKPVINSIKAINNYGDIVISLDENKKSVFKSEFPIKLGRNVLQSINCIINTQVIENEESIKFLNDGLTMYFDYDKIIKSGDIRIRFRRQGDRFTPLGMHGSKKIKDFFMDLKINKEKRDEIPLLCFGKNIGWIIGYRMSELFKLDKNTKNILEVKVESEEA